MASIADVNLKLMSASALLDTDPAAAARAAGEILGHHPDNAAASLLLATAARKLGNTALALEVLEGLARSQPAAAGSASSSADAVISSKFTSAIETMSYDDVRSARLSIRGESSR